MRYFLDTCVCIEFLRGRLPLVRERMCGHSPHQIKIPAVVEAELRLGVLKSARAEENARLLELFLAPYEIVPFDSACVAHYARTRAALEAGGTPIGPNDLLIAATALAHDAILVTDNIREFTRVKGLRLESWGEETLDGEIAF